MHGRPGPSAGLNLEPQVPCQDAEDALRIVGDPTNLKKK